MVLCDEICRFLDGNGLGYRVGRLDGQDVIHIDGHAGIVPVRICSTSAEEAEKAADSLHTTIDGISKETGCYPLIITEDRWNSQQKMMHARLLAHLQIFTQIYARNCEVRKIDKKTAADFLADNHSYGDAACRYRYGLFLKRYTGHTSALTIDRPAAGDLVAVATFSNGRKWIKGDKTIRSYEWTRYASLPGVRLSGGMGKLLQAFIEDVHPDDIMTYADLEWSEGKVYEALGFVLEGTKSPMMFSVDIDSWKRTAHSGPAATSGAPRIPFGQTPPSRGRHVTSSHQPDRSMCCAEEQVQDKIRFFRNLGSNKYRMKLTDYQ